MASEHELGGEQAAAVAASLLRAAAAPRAGAHAGRRISVLHYLEVVAVLAAVLALIYYAGLDATIALVVFFASLAGLVALRVVAMRH